MVKRRADVSNPYACPAGTGKSITRGMPAAAPAAGLNRGVDDPYPNWRMTAARRVRRGGAGDRCRL